MGVLSTSLLLSWKAGGGFRNGRRGYRHLSGFNYHVDVFSSQLDTVRVFHLFPSRRLTLQTCSTRISRDPHQGRAFFSSFVFSVDARPTHRQVRLFHWHFGRYYRMDMVPHNGCFLLVFDP